MTTRIFGVREHFTDASAVFKRHGRENSRYVLGGSYLLMSLLFIWMVLVPIPEANAQFTVPLEGRITVSPEIDDTENYGGIEVLVIQQGPTGVDTLGYAETNREGYFSMEVTAPRRDVYPLVLRRNNQTVAAVDLVIADGEAPSFEIELPGLQGLTRIDSQENMAWISYRNIDEQHNQRMTQLLTENLQGTDQFENNIRQTASILWSLRESFPGTLGAEVASAEALIMIGGWDDEFVLEHIDEITPQNPRYVDVARVAESSARTLRGDEEAIALLREMKENASEQHQAQLQAEIVMALASANRPDEAISEARDLEEAYSHLEGWSEWVSNVSYELENLLPGMPAPDISVTTQSGEHLTLDDLRGDLVVLEFYHPRDGMFERQLDTRRALTELAQEEALTVIAISLEPDPSLNEAFLDGRSVDGHHVFLEEGGESELVERYNISDLPTRVLIDKEGNIRQKFTGGTLPALQEEIVMLLQEDDQ